MSQISQIYRLKSRTFNGSKCLFQQLWYVMISNCNMCEWENIQVLVLYYAFFLRKFSVCKMTKNLRELCLSWVKISLTQILLIEWRQKFEVDSWKKSSDRKVFDWARNAKTEMFSLFRYKQEWYILPLAVDHIHGYLKLVVMAFLCSERCSP